MITKVMRRDIEDGSPRTFYQSRLWRNKREQVRGRDNYECQMCMEDGEVGDGDVVHHIEHLRDRIDLALDEDNLVTLCYYHHNVVHPEKLNKKKELDEKFKERW